MESMIATPLHPAGNISSELNIDLYLKRDDLFPVAGGGNKARKLLGILPKCELKGCNALVTTGGIQSNHARATALLAAEKRWACKLILHGNPKSIGRISGNFLIMHLCGAHILIVPPDMISEAMDDACSELEASGYRPCMIPGGGHCIEGSLTYVAAVKELLFQCNDIGWYPDYIVMASGTGTTHAGIVAGTKGEGFETNVIGISVARENPRGKSAVIQAYSELCEYLNLDFKPEDIDFRDNWISGGYERANNKVLSAIHWAARTEGLILDPTYTGKAMAALLDLVKFGEIKKNSRVLFWHTGGLLNLMADKQICKSLRD